ncbi:MAG: response regulator [Lawsonibacter sp.]|nr:response regulator [Lawsonibacter sp.]
MGSNGERSALRLELNEQTFPIIEQITEGMPGGFFIYYADGDGKLIYTNTALIKMYGCRDRAELQAHTGYTFRGLVHPDDWERVNASIQRQVQDHDGFDYVEYQIIRRDGAVRWIKDYGRFIQTKTYGGVFYVFVEDATERHRREQIAREQALTLEKLKQVQQSNQAKTVFLNNMSHDIRTPMNAIIGFATLACGHMENIELVKDYLTKILTSGNHLLSLINNVLEMSRIESGKVNASQDDFSLLDMMEELQTMVWTEVQSKQLEFELDTSEVSDGRVVCDKLHLTQMLQNVIGNAIKFTPQGGRVTVRLSEKQNLPGDFASYQFRVRDTGIGMSQEFVQRIFEPFEREHTSTVSGIRGSGLGMAITKKMVDMMDGVITVESEVGKGTEFTISLPLRLAKRQNVAEEQPEYIQPLEQMKPFFQGKRILLTEDNDLNREIAMAILTEAGFLVDTAVDGSIAVEKVKTSPPGTYDLILMDIQMPVMDGYEAARRIKALENPSLAAVPIVAMTANAFEEDKKLAFAAGMVGHLAKPVEIPRLFSTLKSLFL